ncbi:MAG: hypothetical protein QOF10_174, partial [Kribbellaceae bacterium]|nr:hypothetical protein [Kribbellaceae bacterium]
DAAKNQNNMVAVEPGRPTGEAWPEASAEPNSPGLMSTVAGKLGVGKHGDLELAKKLLDAERRPATGETGRDTAAGGGAGTRADGATSRASRALGARGPAPAAER